MYRSRRPIVKNPSDGFSKKNAKQTQELEDLPQHQRVIDEDYNSVPGLTRPEAGCSHWQCGESEKLQTFQSKEDLQETRMSGWTCRGKTSKPYEEFLKKEDKSQLKVVLPRCLIEEPDIQSKSPKTGDESKVGLASSSHSKTESNHEASWSSERINLTPGSKEYDTFMLGLFGGRAFPHDKRYAVQSASVWMSQFSEKDIRDVTETKSKVLKRASAMLIMRPHSASDAQGKRSGLKKTMPAPRNPKMMKTKGLKKSAGALMNRKSATVAGSRRYSINRNTSRSPPPRGARKSAGDSPTLSSPGQRSVHSDPSSTKTLTPASFEQDACSEKNKQQHIGDAQDINKELSLFNKLSEIKTANDVLISEQRYTMTPSTWDRNAVPKPWDKWMNVKVSDPSLDKSVSSNSKPKTTLDKNISSNSKPKASLDKIVNPNSKPKASLDKTINPNSKPKVGLDKTINPISKPKATLDKSINPNSKPKASLDKSVNPNSKPKVGLDKSINPNSKPKASLDKSINPNSKPKASLDKSINPNSKPKASLNKIVNPNSKPKAYKSEGFKVRSFNSLHQDVLKSCNRPPIRKSWMASQDPPSLSQTKRLDSAAHLSQRQSWTGRSPPKSPDQTNKGKPPTSSANIGAADPLALSISSKHKAVEDWLEKHVSKSLEETRELSKLSSGSSSISSPETAATSSLLNRHFSSSNTLANITAQAGGVDFYSSHRQVGAWLNSLGLKEVEKYEKLFNQHQIEMVDLSSLTVPVLQHMGISRMGPIMKIMRGVGELKEEISKTTKQMVLKKPPSDPFLGDDFFKMPAAEPISEDAYFRMSSAAKKTDAAAAAEAVIAQNENSKLKATDSEASTSTFKRNTEQEVKDLSASERVQAFRLSLQQLYTNLFGGKLATGKSEENKSTLSRETTHFDRNASKTSSSDEETGFFTVHPTTSSFQQPKKSGKGALQARSSGSITKVTRNVKDHPGSGKLKGQRDTIQQKQSSFKINPGPSMNPPARYPMPWRQHGAADAGSHSPPSHFTSRNRTHQLMGGKKL